MYQVFHRKYRPKVFEEVVGQDLIVKTLKNAILSNRIAHAYLFSGPRGVGKTTLARIFARALNCTKRTDANPCNKCQICQEMLNGETLDIVEIDGASNNKVDEIRELRENVLYAPVRGKYRIYIIDEVHMLTKGAFNALLKTLEEPPSHVIFIFATTEPKNIPLTILSRCQHFPFRKISLKNIISNLQKIAEAESISIDEEGLALIARLADGSLRDAQSLLDQAISFCGNSINYNDLIQLFGLISKEIIRNLLISLANKDVKSALFAFSELINNGYEVREICREILFFLRNILIIKSCETWDFLLDELSDEEISFCKILAEKFEEDEIEWLFDLFSDVERRAKDFPFPKALFEMAILKVGKAKKVIRISQIIDKIEEIERRFKESLFTSDINYVNLKTDEKSLWEEVVKKVKNKRPFLGQLLSKACFDKVENSNLIVYFKKEDLSFYKLEEEEKNFLEEEIENIFNRKLNFIVKTYDKDKNILNHEIVKFVLNEFGGIVKSYRKRGE